MWVAFGDMPWLWFFLSWLMNCSIMLRSNWKERKMIPLLLHLWVGLSLYVIPKRALLESEGPKGKFLLKGEPLQWVGTSWPHLSPLGKAPSSHMVDWNYPGYPNARTVIVGVWMDHTGQGAPEIKLLGKSPIRILFWRLLAYLGIWIKGLVLSHPQICK